MSMVVISLDLAIKMNYIIRLEILKLTGRKMRRNIPIILTGIVLSLFFFEISTSTEPPNQQAPAIPDKLAEYMPLEINDWVEYDRSYWSIPHGYAWVEEITATVVGKDIVLEGEQAFIMKETGVSYDSIWVVFMDDEVRRYEDYPLDYSDYKVLLKLPLELGQRWVFSPFPVDRDTMYAYIFETDASVQVSAGKFEHCIHVYADHYKHFWFAPGIGIIKSSDAEADSLTGTDNDLMNYEIQ